MNRLDEKIRGIVRAKISGGDVQKAISAAAAEGIELSKIRGEEYEAAVSFSERDRERFAALAERCGCDCEIMYARGGSRVRKKIQSRADLLILSFLLFALLYVSSLFIWDIKVVGCEEITVGEVLRLLDAEGVRRGTYWPELSTDTLRCRILLKEPRIGWMTVNVSGSRAVVLIRERAEKPEIYSENAAADLVAAKSGVIRRMSVLNGKPVTVPNTAVTQGETLVSGIMDSIPNAPRQVRAEGSVEARTWYELTSICPSAAQKQFSSAPRSRFALKFGKNRINFYFGSGKAVDECDKIIKEYKLGIRGLFTLPVSIIKETIRKYEVSAPLPGDTGMMRERLYRTLEGGIDGLVEQTDYSVTVTEEASYVTLRAQCLENIAEIREIAPAG